MRRIIIMTTVLGSVPILLLGGCGPVHAAKPTAASTVSRGIQNALNNQQTGVNSANAGDTGILTVGQMAPDVSLVSEKTMRDVKLSSFFGKKPLIVNAWASWCAPCQEETPDLVKMDAKYGSQVQFLGVNLTSLDSVQKAKLFATKYAIQYPVLLDTLGTFYRDYTVIAEPMTYVISSTGKVVSIHIGSLQTQQIQHLVQEALASS